MIALFPIKRLDAFLRLNNRVFAGVGAAFGVFYLVYPFCKPVSFGELSMSWLLGAALLNGAFAEVYERKLRQRYGLW